MNKKSEKNIEEVDRFAEAEAAKKRDAACHKEEITRIKTEIKELLDNDGDGCSVNAD